MHGGTNSQLRFDTACVHAGQEPDPSTGAVMTPVYFTSTYAQSAPGEHKGYEYSRTKNPTRTALEGCLAALECGGDARGGGRGGAYGFAFASGCAAMATLFHKFKSGDHVVCVDDVYGGTFRLLSRVLSRHGIETTYVDLTNPEALAAAWRDRTVAVWIETPTNPLLKLIDIEAVARQARQRGVLVCVDNTFMTPYFQRPLELGADVVLHSTTKYLNGHSDVVGGALIVKDDALAEEVGYLQNAVGAVAGPMDSFLVLRGLKTLSLRMARHGESALRIARWLEARQRSVGDVRRVIYPGLESHPQHALAKRQMRGFGGMVTVELARDLEGTKRFLSAARVFTLAESLGGVESLLDHPAIMTHASVPAETRAKLGISDGLVRLSIGVEDADDLVDDLQRALAA